MAAKFTFLVLTAAVLVAASAGTAPASTVDQVTCQDAVSTLLPCLSFLKGQGPPTPSAPCCVGVQKVNQECALKPDRVKVCQCLKDAATRFGVDPERSKNLPSLCSVHLPFPLVREIDCTKILV
ncbi:hypothetical protein V2J09_015151 [Rumex salicifolius]